MSIEDKDIADLIAKRQAAERSIQGMPEGPRKDKAFEMVFQRLLDGDSRSKPRSRRTRRKQAHTSTSDAPAPATATKAQSAGPRGLLRKLVDEGFFDGPRSLPELVEELRRRGHIYKQPALSPHVLGMTQEGILERKKDKREDGREMWFYQRPD